MNGISNYIYSVSSMAVVASIIAVLLPKNTAGRISIMSVGIIMTAVIVSPIKAIDAGNISGYMEETQREISQYTRTASEKNQKICDEIIEEKLRAYILQRSNEAGIKCDVAIKFENGEPHYAEVFAGGGRDGDKVAEIIRGECGIAKVEVRIKNEEA